MEASRSVILDGVRGRSVFASLLFPVVFLSSKITKAENGRLIVKLSLCTGKKNKNTDAKTSIAYIGMPFYNLLSINYIFSGGQLLFFFFFFPFLCPFFKRDFCLVK